jgi:aryl-alcohol dehydrogenase-like predicted oxidoreductase
MEHRQLGKSSVKVSAVAMGTWAIGGWMWGGTDDENAVKAIKRSLDLGVSSIDTAPVYGFGHAETLVGKAVAGRRRDSFQILTKYGMRWDVTDGEYWFDQKLPNGQTVKVHRCSRKKHVLAECDQCLTRLGTDYIDLFQCHWRDNSTPLSETMEAMDALLKAGKIRAAGVSNFTVAELEECLRYVPLATDQPPYSMLRRDIEADVLPFCRKSGVGVIVYSPLQLGLLTGKMTMDRTFTGDDLRLRSPYFQPENRRKALDFVDQLRPFAGKYNATVGDVVVNWTIQQPGVTAALVGARNAEQAEENAGAAAFMLTAEEVAEINALLAQVKLVIPPPAAKR